MRLANRFEDAGHHLNDQERGLRRRAVLAGK